MLPAASDRDQMAVRFRLERVAEQGLEAEKFRELAGAKKDLLGNFGQAGPAILSRLFCPLFGRFTYPVLVLLPLMEPLPALCGDPLGDQI